MPTGLEELKYYAENSVIRNFSDPKDADISKKGEIVVGTFVDEEKPDYFSVYNKFIEQINDEK